MALIVPTAASAETSVSAYRGINEGSVYAAGSGLVAVSVERGGAVADTASAYGGAYVPIAPQAGDQLKVSVDGQPVFDRTFDGRPTFDASVCGSVSSFSGLRSSATAAVDWVGAYLPGSYYDPSAHADGSVTTLNGETFGGSFDKPVSSDWVVSATTREVVGGVAFWSTVDRKVGACAPAAPQPAPQPAPRDTTPPTGRLAGKTPFSGGLEALLGGSAVSTVTVSEPGVTVTQAVYLNDGAKLPAQIAAKRKKLRKPTLLASGRAVSKAAGAVKVKLRATKKARGLRRRHTVRVAIVTTLRDAAGNVQRLPVKRVTLKK